MSNLHAAIAKEYGIDVETVEFIVSAPKEKLLVLREFLAALEADDEVKAAAITAAIG